MKSTLLSVSLFLFFALLCKNTVNSQYYGYGPPNYYSPYNSYQRGYYPPMPYPYYPMNGVYPQMQYPQHTQQPAVLPPPPVKTVEIVPEVEFRRTNSTLKFQEGAVIDYEYIYDYPPPKTSMKKVMLAKRTKVADKKASSPKKDSTSTTNSNSVSSSYSNINGVIKNITNGVPVETNVKPMPMPIPKPMPVPKPNSWFSVKPTAPNKPVVITKPEKPVIPKLDLKPLPKPKSENEGTIELANVLPINEDISEEILSEEDMYSEEDEESSEDLPANSKTDLSENVTKRSFWG